MTPVVREDYKRALAAARKDYEALVQERKTIDARLLETRDVILSLSKLCEGEAEQVVLPSTDQYVSDSRLQKLSIYGLTDAVRIVLQTHIGAMDAKRIRNRLLVFRYDLSKYSNPMAACTGSRAPRIGWRSIYGKNRGQNYISLDWGGRNDKEFQRLGA